MVACLIIGYGNTLRRDDGLGVEVAERLAAVKLPGVNVITRHQLVPELAAPISEADAVIFVDAHANARGKIRLQPIIPAPTDHVTPHILAHASDPRSLLNLSQQLFGRSPRAWSLGIPAEDFSFGVGLSPRARARLRAAVKLIRALAVKLVPAGTTSSRKGRRGRKE